MNEDQSLLNSAIHLHRSGEFQEAIDIYKKVLPRQRRNPQLLYLLGTASLQIGNVKYALDIIRRSIDINPNNAQAHNNMGLALQTLHRLNEALSSYDKALAIQPRFSEAFNNRGNVLQALIRPGDALCDYDNALVINPSYPEAWNNRGNALRELGRFEEALASYDKAVSIKESYADAYFNRGAVLQDFKNLDAALLSYDRALELNPNSAETHNNRGNVLQDLNRLDEAILSYERALEIRPRHAEAYNNRGNTLRKLKRLRDALESYDNAVALHPDYAVALGNRGAVLHELGRVDDALASYNQALAIEPEFAEVLFHKSFALLSSGKYLEGWSLYESRFKQSEFQNAYYNSAQPRWLGDDIADKTLLVCSEQGFGDVVQFCRYLPQIQALGARLIVEVPERLVELVSTLDCPMSVFARGTPLPKFDAHCSMMSLPYLFKTTLETVPETCPYLFGEPGKVRAWREKLGTQEKLRVGLAWSGGLANKDDASRSMQLESLLPVLEAPGIEWHSLQKEYRQPDLDILARHSGIQQHQDEFHQFSDTAALIECMDLVITVDTSVAHVAAAMGKTVWILLSFSPDFRWMFDRTDTPWYPTAKLYRQDTHGNWKGVIARITQDVAKLASEGTAFPERA
jgi:tetratricopeptide (TPR) repeat protein